MITHLGFLGTLERLRELRDVRHCAIHPILRRGMRVCPDPLDGGSGFHRPSPDPAKADEEQLFPRIGQPGQQILSSIRLRGMELLLPRTVGEDEASISNILARSEVSL